MNFIQSIILDMDGLMLDTEKLAMQAWLNATNEVGIKLNEDIFLRTVGRNSKDIRSILKDYIKKDNQLEVFCECARVHYDKLISEKPIPIKPGLHELLDFLEEQKISKAVATSTKNEVTEMNLKSLGLFERFSTIVTGDQVQRGKPAPEIYLMATDRLGLPPKECLVLEDSENGIRAANAAGTYAVMIPDLITPTEEIRKLAYKIFASINEFLVFFKTARDAT